MAKNTHPLDWSILAMLVVLWGSSFALSKHALTSLDASWVMALRLSIAAVVLVPYAVVQGQSFRAPASVWRKFIWLGLIGHTLPFFLITWGMNFVSSGVAGLLMGAIPLFLVILAHFALPDEPLTIPKSAGFILGFIGIFVLIGPAQILNLSLDGEELRGELAILAGCLSYAVHGVTAKRLGFEHPVRQSASVCLAGAVMGLSFAALFAPRDLGAVPLSAYGAVIGLGLFPTAFATLLTYRLMARIGPSFVAYSNYLVPVYAVLLGALLLGEDLGWNVLLALLLILSGIAISRLRRFQGSRIR
jgi:drug/metabolite transporter (DMT)-like permease